MKLPDVYPFLHRMVAPGVKTHGALDAIGATVHYSAGRSVAGTVSTLTERGLGYHLLIDRQGKVVQLAQLTQKVSHAGPAEWCGQSPNSHHVAVCLMSWGLLAKSNGNFKSWTGAEVPASEVREDQDGKAWDKATPEQEQALIKVLRWLVSCGINPAHVCGHDECATPKGRKIDPGGILAEKMSVIRSALVL